MQRWVSLVRLLFLNIFRHFKIFMRLFLTDFKNVSIVGHYVKDRTKDAQFIIIRYITSNLAFQLSLLPLLHATSREVVIQACICV
jgi:hypothetical protein